MPRQGLNREMIIQAALELIEEEGDLSFRMASLARRLHIKPSSLYNHVESMEDLYTDVGLRAIRLMRETEDRAIKGKEGRDALFALGYAYRDFVKEHNQLYRVIMSFQRMDNPVLEREAGQIAGPILHVLDQYGLAGESKIHWQRILRSMMHGFAVHEAAGGFSHVPVSREESYRIALQCIEDGLRAAGKESEQIENQN